jgi:hypothetical protein
LCPDQTNAVRISLVPVLAVLMLAAGVSGAEAQLIDGPQGAVGGVFGGRRPIDPNLNTQSFETTFDLSGGYDRDPNAAQTDPSLGQEDLTRWYASTGSASARYRVGTNWRRFEARGRGFYNYQSNFDDSLVGGEGVANYTSRFGSRRLNELILQVQTAYEPGWVFGAFGPSLGPGPDDPSIGVAPPQGVLEQRWLAMAGTVGYEHHWNLRHMTTARFDNRRIRQIEGPEIDAVDADWRHLFLEQSWTTRPGFSLIGGYRFDENRQELEGGDFPPIRYHTLDGGVRLEKRLSPTRRFGLTFRGGATRLVDTAVALPIETLHPSVNISGDFATSRYWSMMADFSHGVMVLAGVSPLPVLNDNINVTFNGTPTRKLRYSIAASVAHSDTLVTDPQLRNVTDVAGASGEIRYAMANWSALFATYAFYHHRIEDLSLLATGFPPRYDRHSVRVGVSFWLPLYGTF